MTGVGEIKCARCQTSIAKWEVWNDVATMEQVFRVFCHGEVDECRIDWSRHDPRHIIEAVAFRPALSSGGRKGEA